MFLQQNSANGGQTLFFHGCSLWDVGPLYKYLTGKVHKLTDTGNNGISHTSFFKITVIRKISMANTWHIMIWLMDDIQNCKKHEKGSIPWSLKVTKWSQFIGSRQFAAFVHTFVQNTQGKQLHLALYVRTVSYNACLTTKGEKKSSKAFANRPTADKKEDTMDSCEQSNKHKVCLNGNISSLTEPSRKQQNFLKIDSVHIYWVSQILCNWWSRGGTTFTRWVRFYNTGGGITFKAFKVFR